MFLAILRSEWRWCRGVLIPGTLAALLAPLLSLRGVTMRMMPVEVMNAVGHWSAVFPLLSLGLALLTALGCWGPDRRGDHIHALTLPVARWRYVLLRFGGGVLLLAAPMLACLVGALLATHSTSLPTGLAPYPWSFAFRFAASLLVAFSLLFAILSATPKTAALVLGAVVLVTAADLALGILMPRTGIGNDVWFLLLNGPGPFALFAARWVLVDA
ncbi:MAG TPA: hypothetical protein VFI13_04390 [Gemmatimonadales bacterium]|nr:hypothetical protein [Gemmatimonadales bacterium]